MMTKENIKVSPFPSNWERCKLDDVCEITLGQSPSSDTYNNDGKGIPFFQGKAEFGNLYPTVEKWCTKPKKIAEAGDILISVRAPVGPTNISRERCCIGRGLASLRPKSSMQSLYLFYFLRSIENEWESKATGSTFSAITGAVLRNQSIPLPPRPEQQRIVAKIEELFTQLDAGVTALERARANLRRYRQSVLQAAVTGELTRAWRAAQQHELEPADHLLQRILTERRKKWEDEQRAKGKDPAKLKYKEPQAPDTSGLAELPEGWVWCTLPQLGELNRGKSKFRPRNAPFLYGGPYPFVQTGNVKHANGIITTFEQTYSEAGVNQSRLWPTGTLCITIAANIADTAILGFDACFPDSIVGFVTKSKHSNVKFIEFFFRTAKENIERFAPATAQKNINLNTLSKLAIPLPSLFEQHQIVIEVERRLSVVDALENEISQALQRAARLRQYILKWAFEGKLVAQEEAGFES